MSYATLSAVPCAAQSCRWEFLIFSGSFRIVLSVHMEEAGPRSLVFRRVQSSFMRAMEGRWQVRGRSTNCTL